MLSNSVTQVEADLAVEEVMKDFKKAPHQAEKLREWLVLIFKKWEIQCGTGLPRRGRAAYITSNPMKPYQRHKDFTPSYGDLVRKLLDEKYPDMLAVKKKLELRRILAGAVLVEAKDNPISREGLRCSLDLYRQWRIIAADTDAKVLEKEVKTGSLRQRAFARRPRTNALQSLINEIVKKKPHINCNELLKELDQPEHKDVIEEIEEIEDGTIYYIEKDGRGGHKASISGLKDRLTRARKKLSSR